MRALKFEWLRTRPGDFFKRYVIYVCYSKAQQPRTLTLGPLNCGLVVETLGKTAFFRPINDSIHGHFKREGTV